jgi:hypothetical protein
VIAHGLIDLVASRGAAELAVADHGATTPLAARSTVGLEVAG